MRNVEVADRLGISTVHLSRIRSGTRRPSTDLMMRVHHEFRWSLRQQMTALKQGTWHAEFRVYMWQVYGVPSNLDIPKGTRYRLLDDDEDAGAAPAGDDGNDEDDDDEFDDGE